MAEIPANSPESRRARGRPRDWHDKTAQNTIKSLDRALEVLETLSDMGSATLSELAQTAGESPATVYRVLVTMEGRGMVEFSPAEQLWNIGPRAFLIGSKFLRRTNLVERARPILRRLMEATGETANLGIERGGQVLFLSQIETHASIRAFFPPGTLSPMHSSGIGKALMAQLDADRLSEIIIEHGQQRFTSFTLTDRAALDADLKATRARGYSIDAEERNEGMKCVAAPVFDANGEPVAGISVSGPASRIPDDKITGFGNEVARAAAELSRAIGADR
ncbi:MAG: HTH-type transcriptional regulator BhcR [Aestuariivita sp.]|uniref:HTH-type transcriptional regulator BhcR n=1 Tax=Aestuariivita sp. TaxID=1872407 RepID=UPI003BAFD228